MSSNNHLSCAICLGEISDYGYLFECECKKSYHFECAEGVGKCVFCEKEYEKEYFTENKAFSSFITDGRRLVKLGQYEKGLSLIEFALKIKENSILALNLKGMVKTKLKLYDDALECFERVLKEQKRSETYYNMAGTLIRMKSMDKALECINMALSLKPDDMDSVYLKGYIQSRQGNYQEAIVCFNEVLERKPEHSAAKIEKEKILAKV
jgi:tetratricopeptide (TPR) repeat protein